MSTESTSPQSQRPSRLHRSFLLRCWREPKSNEGGRWGWRFSVREVGDEPKEYPLRSLGQLVDFLTSELFISKIDEK